MPGSTDIAADAEEAAEQARQQVVRIVLELIGHSGVAPSLDQSDERGAELDAELDLAILKCANALLRLSDADEELHIETALHASFLRSEQYKESDTERLARELDETSGTDADPEYRAHRKHDGTPRNDCPYCPSEGTDTDETDRHPG